MKKYKFFDKIEGASPLVNLLNATFEQLSTYRIMTVPEFYHPSDGTGEYAAYMYYHLLVFESYAHELVKRLNDLRADVERYNNEFNGSWRYYALSSRKQYIEEFGPDEEDYDTNGEIRTSYTDKELNPDSLVNDYIGWNDILLRLKAKDFARTFHYLIRKGETAWSKMPLFKDVPTSRIVDGKLVENTWEDTVLQEAKAQAETDNVADMLHSVLQAVDQFFEEFKGLKFDDDNTAFFSQAIERIDALMELRVPLKKIVQ